MPTRITNHPAIFTDDIYTNNTNQMISGIATIDITGIYFFCTVDIPVQKMSTMQSTI